jgi:uncharacterized membrane protein
MKQYVAVGVTVLAGAALLEAALVPGIVIGGAAVLAPSLTRFARRRLLGPGSKPRRRTAAAQTTGQDSSRALVPAAPRALLPRFAFGQAIAKTITYRIIVTTLDFSTNYIVIGEFATAAGLSTFNLIAGPLFYLGHEAVWNYLGPGEAVDVPVIPSAEHEQGGWGRFTVSRALAKTVTFRTIATVMDFTTNYVVVGDVASAVLLSATGFVLGPFVYYGHEKAWDYFGPRVDKKLEMLPSA